MGVDAWMVARSPVRVSDPQVREWAYRLFEAFGNEVIFVSDASGDFHERRALARVEEAEREDTAPGVPPADTLLAVSLWGRYYGPDYERGPLQDYILLTEWLEHNIPECEVWYGGDTGAALELFDAEARKKFVAHYSAHGHNNYFSRRFAPLECKGNPLCDFCDKPMGRIGFGLAYAHYECFGCGAAVYTCGDGWFKSHHTGGNRIEGVDEFFPAQGQGIKMEALRFFTP